MGVVPFGTIYMAFIAKRNCSKNPLRLLWRRLLTRKKESNNRRFIRGYQPFCTTACGFTNALDARKEIFVKKMLDCVFSDLLLSEASGSIGCRRFLYPSETFFNSCSGSCFWSDESNPTARVATISIPVFWKFRIIT